MDEGGHGIAWSSRSYARLGIPLRDVFGDVHLTFHWMPYLGAGKVAAQDVAIYVNDQHLQDIRLAQADLQEYRLDVPQEMIADAFLRIAFRLPGALSSASCGAGPDKRTLGGGLKSLALSAD